MAAKKNPIKYGNDNSTSRGTGHFGQSNMTETPKPNRSTLGSMKNTQPKFAPDTKQNKQPTTRGGRPLSKFTDRVTNADNKPVIGSSAPKPATSKASKLAGVQKYPGTTTTTTTDKTTGRSAGSGKTSSRTVKQGVTAKSST